MILKNAQYIDVAEQIKRDKCSVVIYGAGMIGKIVVPYIVKQYDLYNYVECYVDMDQSKIGTQVQMEEHAYEIQHPDMLRQKKDKRIIFITNSKFYPVIEYLDGMEALEETQAYLIPVMQIQQAHQAIPVTLPTEAEEGSIPKVIHYCWFGKKEMPDFLKKCIASWKRVCPDYEIIEWNESNYDVSKFSYSKEAYENGKYGFVTDIARLDILYTYGGIYLDTDVMLLKSPEPLLFQKAFVGVEKWGNINSGGMMGAEPGHPMLKELLDYRKQFHFVNDDGSLNLETNGVYETIPFINRGMKINNTLQVINDVTVYPSSVFHPYDYMSGEDRMEEWTFSKHYFYGGWMEKSDIDNRTDTQCKYSQIVERMKK